MRTLTANAQAKLSQNTGTELMVILEVEWTDGGSVFYSDQEVAGCQAKILDMGGFDTSMVLEGSSDSQQLNIVLDDTDGSIRNIYDSYDIHKRPSRVYLLHKGLSLELDKILIFKGELVTPIEWDETQRSASFNILSKLNNIQVGFSMEEGDFPNIPDEALGKAWPLVFGQVCHIPAVKVRAPRRGYLQTGVGIHDFTLEPRICQAVKIQCPSQSTGNQSFLQQGPNNTWSGSVEKTVGPDLECVNRRYGEICRLKDLLGQQQAFEYDEFDVYNGVSFPQGRKITIFVDNATFTGTFSGNTFSVIDRKHPEYDDFNHVPCRDVPTFGYGLTTGVPQIGGTVDPNIVGTGNTILGAGGFDKISPLTPVDSGLYTKRVWIPDQRTTHYRPQQTQEQAFASCDAALTTTPGMVGGPKESWDYYDEMEESSFFWAPAGSEVYMEDESEILYIVSLLPGTVDGVAAFRQAPNGFRYLTEVPADFYTVYETDYGGYNVVEVGLDKALSLRNDQWDNQIYVSFTSSVGPNPADIIEWLIEKYTDLTIDSSSFAIVKSYLTNYPSNFYLTSRPDIFDLIQDIAYQSRCSVYIRNDVVYIKYLSVEPTSVRTINESDILSGTFREFLSETEDVYTTHNITWRKGGAAVRNDQEVDRKLVLKYNVNKYGTVEEDWDYYTYNIYELVLKSGTFWLIRKSTSWKKVEFDLSIKHIDLDVGDTIELSVAQFSSDNVKVVIERMNLNPDENTVHVVCWTPIRTGETAPYYWAWPSQQAAHQIWPLAGDNNGGGGYNFDVTPPVGHILTGGSHRDDQLIITSGDLHPSDLDDTLPTVECELSDYLNFNTKAPEIIAKEIAQSAARQGMENTMSGGGNAGGGDGEKESDCGAGDLGCCGGGISCNYRVIVQWHTSVLQGLATVFGGSKPGGPCGGPCRCLQGCPSCSGPIWDVCHTHSAPWAARHAKKYWEGRYGNPSDFWQCGQTAVLKVSIGEGPHRGPYADDCPGLNDDIPENALAGDDVNSSPIEEVTEPTGLTGDEPEATAGESLA